MAMSDEQEKVIDKRKQAKTEKEIEVLRQQYPIAVDLYKHEDLLNWNKLNHFFYVTAGLVALLGFVLKGNEGRTMYKGDELYIFFAIVGFLGCGISWAFWGVLDCGARYLNNRKDTVMEIEKILMKYGAEDLVSNVNLPEEERKLFERALTVKILRNLPLFMLVVWAVVFGLALFKLV
jgi:hypothetical protein